MKKLSGHSGCSVWLMDNQGKPFVRKQSGSLPYNMRLKRQFIKQRKFCLSNIKTPAILGCGLNNGLFYFDMEFIQGVPMSQYMDNIKVGEIEHLISLLFHSLQIKKGKKYINADKIFKTKIASLEKMLDKNGVIEKCLSKLKYFNFSSVPYSACCGDLTLENIILSPEGIYVIDLLDSFYNSWMIDVAKLLQDVDLYWAYRDIQMSPVLKKNLLLVKNLLSRKIFRLENGPEKLLTIYHLLLLNLLRIYPYSVDEKTIKFLDKSCIACLQTIKNWR